MKAHEALYRLVATRIRDAREKAGLSQQELADKVGLTRAAVANLENRRQAISLHVVFEIGKAFGMDPLALLPNLEEVKLAQAEETEVAIAGTQQKLQTDLYEKIVNVLGLQEEDSVK